MEDMQVRVLGQTLEIITDVDSVLAVRRMIGNLREDIYHRRAELGTEFNWLWDACSRILALQERPARFSGSSANIEDEINDQHEGK